MSKAPPAILYGTAWKAAATPDCVARALAAGFRGIDTANQRKHYWEAGVGQAIAASGIPRDQLWLQTKFTHRDGQDHRLPYDEGAPLATQVAQSFALSLDHLGVTYIDSLVLHGPSQREGLGPDDHAAWRAMEALAESGRVHALGISNVTAKQVADLVAFAQIAPRFVQNRCYAERGWDRAVRELCSAHAIVYQGFSLLTANRPVLLKPGVLAITRARGVTAEQVVLRFAQQLGMLPLTGTTSSEHMAEDLAISGFTLDARELAALA